MEETKEKEVDEIKEEQKENKKDFISDMIKWIKKPYVYIPLIAVFIISFIVGLIPEKKIETTCYLDETCTAVSTELTITDVDYTDYYLSSSGSKVYSNDTIITIYGGIFNVSSSSKSIDKSSFSLELSNGKTVKPKSAIFTDNVSYEANKISLNANRGVMFYIFYEVKDANIEECRIIYYGNAIALTTRPAQ